MENRRVVITGLGVVAPGASSVDEFWSNLENGYSQVSFIDKCDTTFTHVKVGGQIKDINAEEYIKKRFLYKCDDFSKYSLIATYKALADSKLETKELDSERIGIVVGNNSGGWHAAEEGLITLHSEGPEDVSAFLASNWFPAAPQGHISIYNQIKGYSKTIVGDMASSNIAIGNAAQIIRDGKADYMIAGGTENLIVTWGILFYQTSGILCYESSSPEKAYKPFSKNRCGLVLADGASYVVLETLKSAKKRNAPIYGEICGYGLTNDGVNYQGGNPNGKQYARAIKLAMKEDVHRTIPDYISLNGAAVKQEDDSETNGIKLAFGEDVKKITCSCPKSYYGHSFGAAGGLDLVTACLSMKYNKVIKTGFVDEVNADNVDIVTGNNRDMEVNRCLVVNKGMGGINSVLYIKKLI